MHKRFVNHCTIELTISPVSPILIKSGREGADPTKPDMEFVETYHEDGRTIYLPSSSLKGAIRAHAERIVRTVGESKRQTRKNSSIWASNPLDDQDTNNNPNIYLENWKNTQKKLKPEARHKNPGAELYKQSCFISQLFGNTSVASHLRVTDAYPHKSTIKLEERNGVAIDRVFGSAVKGALFNYQVCTAGEFETKIHLKNFTLAQLGLIGLVLRDLDEGWFGLGFAKSRGLGVVQVTLKKAVVQYPGCQLKNQQIYRLGNQELLPNNMLLGAGEFLTPKEAQEDYGFPVPDRQVTPIRAEPMKFDFGVQMQWLGNGETGVPDLFVKAVKSWSKLFENQVV